MRAFGIVGDGAQELQDRLVAVLADEGPVATVSEAAGNQTPPENVATACRIGDGSRTTVRRDGNLDDALDELAPDHSYAIVLDHPEKELPHVLVGDPPYDGRVLAEVADPSEADLEVIRRELAGIEPHETLESLVAAVERSPKANRAGAIATFTGRVRERDGADDAPTEFLEFEKYDEVADETFDAIRNDLEARDGVQAVRLHHRTGVVEAGEHIVFVVVLAGHRKEAFTTVEDGIDRLKAEVPIFKREVTVAESYWVHERE